MMKKHKEEFRSSMYDFLNAAIALMSIAENILNEIPVDNSEKIPYDTFKNPVCRGCFELNTACGRCEACLWVKQRRGLG